MKGDAPDQDPNIGKAALMSARLGKQYLGWMKDRATITDAWSAEDRARYENTFVPLQDDFIQTAKTWDSPQAQRAAAREAVADVAQQTKVAQAANDRSMAAMGIDPNSGRFAAGRRGIAIDTGLAKAGAANMARRQRRTEGVQMMGDAINLGSGMAVNPLSSFSAGTAAASRGFEGAMQGYGQQADILNQQYRNQIAGYQADQESSGQLFGALGTAAGMAIGSPWLSAAMGGIAGIR